MQTGETRTLEDNPHSRIPCAGAEVLGWYSLVFPRRHKRRLSGRRRCQTGGLPIKCRTTRAACGAEVLLRGDERRGPRITRVPTARQDSGGGTATSSPTRPGTTSGGPLAKGSSRAAVDTPRETSRQLDETLARLDREHLLVIELGDLAHLLVEPNTEPFVPQRGPAQPGVDDLAATLAAAKRFRMS